MAVQEDLLQTLFKAFVAEARAAFVLRYPDADPDENQVLMTHFEALNCFVERIRTMLRENQPTGMEYIDAGFAIRFQDGQVVPFITDTTVEVTGGVGGAIPVTKPDTRREPGMAPARSWGVTGDESGE